MPITSVLVGSSPNWSDQTITAPSGTVTASLGALYLDHDTAALSLVEQVKTIAGVSNAFIRKDGLIEIVLSSSGPLTFGSATILRDLLGFTGDRTAATNHVADVQSPLLWVPMRRDQPGSDTLIDEEGKTRTLVDVTRGRTGFGISVEFGGPKVRTFRWTYVPKARMKTADENNGEYIVFHQAVAVPQARFLVHRNVEMDDASGDAASLGTALGPYQADIDAEGATLNLKRSSGFERVDRLFDYDLDVVKVAEYG